MPDLEGWGQAQGGVGKMRSKCASSSSTAWFCWAMPATRLTGSRSGRSSVGPNTMPMFWRVMRLTSTRSITLGMCRVGGWSHPALVLPASPQGVHVPGLHHSGRP